MGGKTKLENGKRLTVFEIMCLAASNADYMHMAICPSCHRCMNVVYVGSSGQEFWCPTYGCNAGFKYRLDGEFERVALCPTEWVGEDA